MAPIRQGHIAFLTVTSNQSTNISISTELFYLANPRREFSSLSSFHLGSLEPALKENPQNNFTEPSLTMKRRRNRIYSTSQTTVAIIIIVFSSARPIVMAFPLQKFRRRFRRTFRIHNLANELKSQSPLSLSKIFSNSQVNISLACPPLTKPRDAPSDTRRGIYKPVPPLSSLSFSSSYKSLHGRKGEI